MPAIELRGVVKRFGEITAVDGLDLDVPLGKCVGLLGPNGAGKSTLLNLLSGDLAASSGSIVFKGHEISRYRADQRSRLGIGRSYQKTNIFPAFTVFENCRLAAQSRLPRALALFAVAHAEPSSCERAHRALALAGIAEHAKRPAGTLSHGAQRQLEVAMVLATEPEVLLLDEPLAGMGADESARMVELLRNLADDHAILLVEHDMDAVFALADRITVMVNGQVLESGPPAQIRASAAVQQAYLGHEEHGL
jgi:branched-chain amino acid transport system ATP-binding protein